MNSNPAASVSALPFDCAQGKLAQGDKGARGALVAACFQVVVFEILRYRSG